MNYTGKTSVRFIVPDFATNHQKGLFFEKVAGALLRHQRYEVIERVRFTGMEIDLFAKHLDSYQTAFVECKFMNKHISSKVLDQLLGKAYRRGADLAYLFSSSPLGMEAKGAIEELEAETRKLRIIFVGPEKLVQMLSSLYSTEPSDLPHVSLATLIVSPDLEPFWLLETRNDVDSLVIQASPTAKDSTIDKMTKLLNENGLKVQLALRFPSEQKATLFLAKSARVKPDTLDLLEKLSDA